MTTDALTLTSAAISPDPLASSRRDRRVRRWLLAGVGALVGTMSLAISTVESADAASPRFPVETLTDPMSHVESPHSAALRTANDGFVAVSPTRLVDTRTGVGAAAGPVAPGQRVSVAIADVPTDTAAVMVNVTATGATGDGYFSVWNCDDEQPGTSNGNYVGITTIANKAIVPISTAGEICLTTGDAPAELIVDLKGYFTAGSGLVAIIPERLVDTRSGVGAPGIPVDPTDTLPLTMSDLPADAGAVVLNVTATGATGDGYFSVWNCDDERPGTSNGNFVGLDTVAATVVSTVGDTGDVCLATGDAAAHLIVDLKGYFTAGSGLVAIIPERLVDTRTGVGAAAGPVAPGQRVSVAIADVPTDTAAVMVNVTATGATGDGYFSVWNCDDEQPGTSNGNYVGITTIANKAIVPISTAGEICLTTGDAPAELIVDVFGHLNTAPGPSPTPGPAPAPGPGPAPAPAPGPSPEGFPLRAGGLEDADGHDIVLLGDGSMLITGTFMGSIDFGTTTLTSAGESDVFVAKLHPDASWQWAVRIGTSRWEGVQSLAAFADGSSVITGYTEVDAAIIPMVARISASGTVEWTATAPSTKEALGLDIVAHSDGTATIVGYFYDQIDFGPHRLNNNLDERTGSFIATIDADGDWISAETTSNTDESLMSGIAEQTDGSILISGRFRDSVTFGTGVGALSLNSVGLNDGFVAKRNTDGTWAWAEPISSPGFINPRRVAVTPDGDAIVMGDRVGQTSFGDITIGAAQPDQGAFVAKVGANGGWQWATTSSGSMEQYPIGLAVANDGSAILAGFFMGSIEFGPTTLTSAGQFDIFVAKVNATGTWAWATSAGGSNFAGGYGVAVLDDGSSVVVGSFYETATFGSTSLTSAGDGDLFAARVTAAGSFE